MKVCESILELKTDATSSILKVCYIMYVLTEKRIFVFSDMLLSYGNISFCLMDCHMPNNIICALLVVSSIKQPKEKEAIKCSSKSITFSRDNAHSSINNIKAF